jgi:hypothetical protein
MEKRKFLIPLVSCITIKVVCVAIVVLLFIWLVLAGLMVSIHNVGDHLGCVTGIASIPTRSKRTGCF